LLLRPTALAIADTNCDLIERALRAYGKLNLGMLRKDVEQAFKDDGGPQFREHSRYVYRECEYIKMELDFSTGANGIQNADATRDTITRKSKLFLDYPVKD